MKFKCSFTLSMIALLLASCSAAPSQSDTGGGGGGGDPDIGHQHTYIKKRGHEATCTESGISLDTYYYCEGCNTYFNDQYKEIKLEDYYEAPLGHNYIVVNTVAPTYESDGIIYYECTRCQDTYSEKGEDKLSHHYSSMWLHDEENDTHYHPCIDDGYSDLRQGEESCTYDLHHKIRYYNQDGEDVYECATCHHQKTEVVDERVNHTITKDFVYDEHGHWKEGSDLPAETIVDPDGTSYQCASYIDEDGVTVYLVGDSNHGTIYNYALHSYSSWELDENTDGDRKLGKKHHTCGTCGHVEYLYFIGNFKVKLDKETRTCSITILSNSSTKNITIKDYYTADDINYKVTKVDDLSLLPELETLSIPETVNELYLGYLPKLKSLTTPIPSKNIEINTTTNELFHIASLFEQKESEYYSHINGDYYVPYNYYNKHKEGNFDLYIPTSLETININNAPEGNIPPFALSYLEHVKTISVYNDAKTFQYGCFALSTNIESFDLPRNLEKIDSYAFMDCYKLATISLYDKLTMIGGYAFENTPIVTANYYGTIASWSIINGTSELPKCVHLYENGVEVESITINGSSTPIPNISRLASIKEINFYGTTEEWFELEGKNNIACDVHLYLDGSNQPATTITVPSSVTEIRNYEFNGCVDLTDITFRPTVTKIAFYAISDNCSAKLNFIGSLKQLSEIECPYHIYLYEEGSSEPISTLEIGNDIDSLYILDIVFGISSIKYVGSIQHWNDMAYKNYASKPVHFYFDNAIEEYTSVTIPDDITTLTNYFFYNCENVKTFSFGDSITSIEKNMLYNSSISRINFTGSLAGFLNVSSTYNFIKAVHFYFDNSTTEFTNITLTSDITELPSYAFYNCPSITSVSFDHCEITRSGSHVFEHTPIDTIYVYGKVGYIHFFDYYNINNVYFFGSFDDWMTSNNINYNPIHLNFDGEDTINLVVPEGYEEIDASRFTRCQDIESVTFNSDLKCIRDHAFYDCNKLTTVNFNEGLEEIEQSAFYSCTAITTITLPSTIQTIGEACFNGCSNLTTVYIPSGIALIGDRAFYNCTSLESVYYSGSKDEFLSLLDDGNIIYIINTKNTVIHCSDGIINVDF